MSLEVTILSISSFILSAISLLVVLLFSWFGGRLYCNSICPVGLLLGLLSRFSIFSLRLDSGRCTGCGLCVRSCKGRCIDLANVAIDVHNCVVCGNCISTCKRGVITFGRFSTSSVAVVNSSRRNGLMVLGSAIGVSLVGNRLSCGV